MLLHGHDLSDAALALDAALEDAADALAAARDAARSLAAGLPGEREPAWAAEAARRLGVLMSLVVTVAEMEELREAVRRAEGGAEP